VSTIIINTTDYFVIVGVATLNPLSQKFDVYNNNGFIYTGAIISDFLIFTTLSLSSSPNNNVNISVFKNDSRQIPISSSITTPTGGNVENVALSGVVSLIPGDNVNIRCRNLTGANNVTIIDLSFIIHRI